MYNQCCNSHEYHIISRFTCFKIAILSSGSFQAVLSFFFLLAQAEKRAFSQLKAFISAEVRKKNSLKRTSKKNRNFRHVNWLIIYQPKRACKLKLQLKTVCIESAIYE